MRALVGHVSEQTQGDYPEGIFGIDMVPRRAKREVAPAILFYLVREFAARVPLSCLLQVEDDVRPYLAAAIVDAIK